MRKRIKGFTLIELLAVIVILAVILLIVVPIVLNVIGDSRKGAFESSAMGLIKTAENACMSYALRHDPVARETLFSDGEMSGYELNFTGKPPVGGYVYINEQCEIQLAVHNNEWCAIKDYDELEVTLVPYDGNCEIEGGLSEFFDEDYGIDSYEDDEISCMINGFCDGITLPDDYIGTEGTWIPVANGNELDNIRHEEINIFGLGTIWEGLYEGGTIAKRYIQVANVSLASFDNWEPFYWADEIYYDGGGYEISNLTRSIPYNWSFGLFDFVENSSIIRNIILDSPEFINTGTSGGALVGYIEDSIVENCVVKNLVITDNGDISGAGFGGLIGWADSWGGDGTKINNCHAINPTIILANFSNYADAGGLVGGYEKVHIINSSARNVYISIDQGNAAGGLIGGGRDGIFEKVYASGNVSGNLYIGGLIGFADDSSSRPFILKNSYTITNVMTNISSVGGIIGFLDIDNPESMVENVYAAGEVKITVEPSEYGQPWWPEYVQGFVGELVFWPPPYDDPIKSIIGVYYDKDVATTKYNLETTRYAAFNGPEIPAIHYFDNRFPLPSSLEIVSDRELPNWEMLPDLRSLQFEHGTHCYWDEILGTFNSTHVWQDFQVEHPYIVPDHIRDRINLYRNGIKASTTQYSIPDRESGIIRARGTAGEEVTVDYCTTNMPIHFTYDLDPDWHGHPKSTSEMKQQSTYEGWDFDSIWAIDPNINNGYPYLR